MLVGLLSKARHDVSASAHWIHIFVPYQTLGHRQGDLLSSILRIFLRQ